MPEAVLDRATALLATSAEFSVLASVKQQPQNAGTIVAFSFDTNRWDRPDSQWLIKSKTNNRFVTRRAKILGYQGCDVSVLLQM